MTAMESNGTEHEASGSKPDANDDLKTLPVVEVEKRLCLVPGWPHPGRGREAPDAVRPERDRGEEGQPAAEVPHLLLGAHPLDDRGGRDPVRRAQALARLLHH